MVEDEVRLLVLATTAAAIVGSAPPAAGAANDTRSATAATTSAAGSVVALKKTGLGQILVDSRGRTLYLFLKDRNRQSACNSGCSAYWPPLISTGKPRAGTGVRSSLLALIKRQDGRQQVTYAGHPLYTFLLDKKAGQTKGEGSTNFGAPWYAVGANGSAINAAPSAASSPAGGGYSYSVGG